LAGMTRIRGAGPGVLPHPPRPSRAEHRPVPEPRFSILVRGEVRCRGIVACRGARCREPDIACAG
jgi:hypothetical protein